ncbi:MAG: uncharacterized protein A8A55_0600 [Amphiamblys sp. WSBS2006]|nr:MAG: uncharacterized protein A8A55_0600 [Amphiamblys sp. WSBS2006]
MDGNLLKEIQRGVRLNKTTTKDRSAPMTSGKTFTQNNTQQMPQSTRREPQPAFNTDKENDMESELKEIFRRKNLAGNTPLQTAGRGQLQKTFSAPPPPPPQAQPRAENRQSHFPPNRHGDETPSWKAPEKKQETQPVPKGFPHKYIPTPKRNTYPEPPPPTKQHPQNTIRPQDSFSTQGKPTPPPRTFQKQKPSFNLPPPRQFQNLEKTYKSKTKSPGERLDAIDAELKRAIERQDFDLCILLKKEKEKIQNLK